MVFELIIEDLRAWKTAWCIIDFELLLLEFVIHHLFCISWWFLKLCMLFRHHTAFV
jgi:hypothetical protein